MNRRNFFQSATLTAIAPLATVAAAKPETTLTVVGKDREVHRFLIKKADLTPDQALNTTVEYSVIKREVYPEPHDSRLNNEFIQPPEGTSFFMKYGVRARLRWKFIPRYRLEHVGNTAMVTTFKNPGVDYTDIVNTFWTGMNEGRVSLLRNQTWRKAYLSA